MAAVAVAAQAEGLLPLSQHALIVLPRLAYHDYEGIALNLDERERLVRDGNAHFDDWETAKTRISKRARES